MEQGHTIDQLNIGDNAKKIRTFTDEDVQDFARLSGDRNPLHLDEEFASQTCFKHRVVHGHLVSSMFSDILGNILPGLGTIYLKQNMTYIKPVYLGDTITAQVTIIEKNLEKNRVICETNSYNQKGELVVVGQAVVLPPLRKEH